MFRMLGWFVLRDTTDGNDVFSHLSSVADWGRQRLWEVGPEYDFAVDVHNGDHILTVTMVHNHDGGISASVRTVLEEIGRKAPGSFGVLYFRDSDYAPGNFQRLVMRRGVVEIVDDDLLNPVVPTIEDP